MKEYYCTVCGRKHNGKYSSKYCRKHQWQITKFGHVLDNNPRTKYDPNEFRFVGNDVVEFDTYCLPSMRVSNTFIIDAEDYPLVSQFKWQDINGGYAGTGHPVILLHRLIMQPKSGQQVDHINLNTFDNRKCNLRYSDNSLNQTNRKPYNKYDIKGIEYHKKENKWSAYFRISNKQYHSPCYKTQEEAAFARYI